VSRRLGTGLVHLGLGNFHRAHQAVYTEDAGDGWGICAVTRRRELVEAMRAQGGAYCVLERGPEEDSVRVIRAIRDVIRAGDEIELIADPATHVVTLTVSEAGYGRDSAALGRLAAALRARPAGAPLAVLSCDNLTGNGRVLRTRMAELAGEAAVESVDFPNTMVDRIVPAATDADRETAERLTGARDEATVVGEPFSQWVIEDAFRGERPQWERAGAMLVADVAPYERLKLRLINGGHSALAYAGLLAGHETVADAMADDALRARLEATIDDELLPTVGEVPGIDPADYREATLTRFANPRMGHRLAQIAADGPAKLPPRLLAPARELLAAGREPRGIATAIAAWLRWIAGQDYAQGPQAEIAAALARAGGPRDAAELALEVRDVFGEDLRESRLFVDLVAEGIGSAG
jgi:fructuronate reductase